MNREFTSDLKERDQIFRSAVILERSIFDSTKTIYVPPRVRTLKATTARDTPIVVEIHSAFIDYNIRLADIATAMDPVIESALFDAGLKDTDRKLWTLHKQYAEQVRSNPEDSPEFPGLLFVPDLSTFHNGLPQSAASSNEESDEFESRLEDAAKLIRRLADSLERVLRTVDRRAVSRRVHVDIKEKRLVIDGIEYMRLNEYSLRFFFHIARAGGHYITAAAIAGDSKSAKIAREGQFRTERVKDELRKKYPKLLELFETKEGIGSRLILPLPTE